MTARGFEPSPDRGSSTDIGADIRDLAGRLREACEQDRPVLTTRGLLSIADRLERIARYVTDAWSALEADDLPVAKIKYALGVGRTHAILLHTIAAEPGKIHSRQKLRRAARSGSDKVVDVNLCTLRAKLREHGFGSPIQTARGQGYWMSPEAAARIATLWRPA